jgi:hypothetical protein
MNLFRKLSIGSSIVAILSAILAGPAFASVTVSSPGSGADVSSPFTLSADATTCSSQNVAAMGYSFDSSSSTTIISGTSIQTSVTSSAGSHTLHVKAWGNQGASCVTDVPITVGAIPVTSALTIPSGAVSVSNIQALSNWSATNDSGGAGSSNGSTQIVGSPSLAGGTRQFVSNYSNAGDERYSASFGDDTTSTNFLYDAYVYLTSSSSKIANIEMDLNQTMANGQTVIFGFQCDGYSSTWDYTANNGTPTKPVDVWVRSGAYCNPRGWSINTWHHVQISYSRNSSGQVTYNTVYLDGLEEPINATVSSAFALGWGPVLLTNFEIDGLGSGGSATAYLDNLTVYRW